MQAIEKDGLHREPEPFDPARIMQLLNEPKVKEVRVFRLQKGMTLNVQGRKYKVIAARPNGKVTMKLIE